MKKIRWSVIAIVWWGGLFVSCSKDKDNPAPVAPTLDFAGIDKVLADSVPVRFDGKCYTVISVGGQSVYTKEFGGYTGETKQLIASSTKWLSGAVIMSLVDEGTLKLSDSIGKYLPVFTAHGKGSITVVQLFSHTSGFPGESSQGYEKDPSLTLEQSVDLIAQNVALINPPGTKFHYGGVSMQVGGRIAEVVSGKDWKTLFREKIGTPCGMSNTDFGSTSNPIIAGGGRSTANEYIKFLNMILEGGITTNGKRVLSEAAVTTMITSQVGIAEVEYSPYPPALLTGTGLYAVGNWLDAPGENSSPGAFGAHPWVNFDKRMVGIVFTYVPVDGFVSTLPTCFQVRKLARQIVP